MSKRKKNRKKQKRHSIQASLPKQPAETGTTSGRTTTAIEPSAQARADGKPGSKALFVPAERLPSGKLDTSNLPPLQWVWKVEDLLKAAGNADGKIDFAKLEEEPALRDWLERQRKRYHAGRLMDAQVKELESLGIDWDKPLRKTRVRRKLRAKIDELKQEALTADGKIDLQEVAKRPRLARWLDQQRLRRKKGTLPDHEMQELEKLGIDWEKMMAPEPRWDRRIKELKEGALDASGKIDPLKISGNRSLSSWLNRQRKRRSEGRLPEFRVRELDALGIQWERPVQFPADWRARLEELKRTGLSCDGKIDLEKVRENRRIRIWLERQRLRQVRGLLAEPQAEELEKLGIDWEVSANPRKEKQSEPGVRERRWEMRLEDLRDFVEQENITRWREITSSSLRLWLTVQRGRFHRGTLLEERKKKIDEVLPFDWTAKREKRAPRAPSTAWTDFYQQFVEESKRAGGEMRRVDFSEQFRSWIDFQRLQYRRGRLSEERIRLLERAGMDWDPGDVGVTRAWWKRFDELQQLYKKRGGKLDLRRSRQEDAAHLRWVTKMRRMWREGRLKPAQEEALRRIEIGPEPVAIQNWNERFEELKSFVEKKFAGRIPPLERLPGDLRRWAHYQRILHRNNRLEEWKVNVLDEMKMPWSDVVRTLPEWFEKYEILKRFREEHGHTRVPRGHKKLGAWVDYQRERGRRGILNDEEKQLLGKIGFVYDTREGPTPQWIDNYRRLEAFYAKYGHTRVPRYYEPDQGLAEFVAQQKQRRKKNMLKPFHIELLDKLDFPWTTRKLRKAQSWEASYRELEVFWKEHGHTRVPRQEMRRLAMWLSAQKYHHKHGRLPERKKKLLDKLGVNWETSTKRRKKKELL